MRYEYRVEVTENEDRKESELLASLGAEGWELCAVHSYTTFRRGDTYTHYYFKRDIGQRCLYSR
jgi:hypothetical protein